ncbi:stabilin-2-like isoform X1 [Haliotis cracherodii]|uniref:stabilin-2-like isoform X1 n=1 Tax=Haliotis cracherodii TaxID=6455 RepID=UPI0039EABF20
MLHYSTIMGLLTNIGVTYVIIQAAVIFAVIPDGSSERFCNRTFTSNFTTQCTACVRNKDVECPYNATKLTTGKGLADCMYIVTLGGSKIVQLAGCHHLCYRTAISVKCCSGYWGPQCEECPGGADNVCSGHGLCSEGIDGIGTCDCDENFTGTVCELCTNNTLYGPNCTEECQCGNGTCNNGVFGDGSCDCFSGFTGDYCDINIFGCENMTCDNNSRCQEIDGNTTCVCDHGYEERDNKTCSPIDNCVESPCHVYASCTPTGPAEHECSCNSGYSGDGVYCEPINPCQVDNGGCVVLKSVCMYMGPNRSACDCMAGFENYVPGYGCSLIDICSSVSCHKNATCITVSPNAIECTCNEGFVGDGQECYGNIMQRLEDLNGNDPDLKNQLTFAMEMLNTGYREALTLQGPFTIFVPASQGFKSVFKTSTFESFLADRGKVRQIIRQHMIIGQLSLDDLQNHTDYFTLQGVPLTLSLRARSEVFKYRLRGQSDKSKILKGDLVCANGMIHITNSLITMEPEIVGDPEKTVLDMINQEGRYRRFQSHVQRLGLESLFEAGNVTVFVPNNRVWDDLPEGTVEYLMSYDGFPTLRKIMENHIFPGTTHVADLINKRRIISLSNSAVSIGIRPNGLIQLNGNVNISQADITCRNGIYYHIESLLVPADMGDVLPKRCDVRTFRIVRGSCDVCYGDLKCPLPTDKPLKTVISGCRYWVNIEGQYVAYVGCARMCNRTYTRKRCCPGFYGEDCQSCPGGFQRPCNGRGKCFDSLYGNGTCFCEKNFSGLACQNCAGIETFGPNCSQKCSCLHGDCDDGTQGTGTCRSNSCFEGFVGDNCDRRLTKCGLYNQLCHAYSQCFQEGETFGCLCKPGYEGDGLNCHEIDPCAKADRGGCHLQATCTKVGPDMPKCECDEGWVGDGFNCQQENPCMRQGDCGGNATCRTITVGQYHCLCDDGYFGNGSVCSPTNSCLSNNGGCHAKAFCFSVGAGLNNCSCMRDYGGDGYSCYSSISQEILDHPRLTVLASLLKIIDSDDNFLQDRSENFTVFAPTNDALDNFTALSPEGYFKNPENVLTMLRFHTMENAYTTYNLLQLSKAYPSFNTLYDGYSIRISAKNQTILIFNSQTSTSTVSMGNIPALNGYIHIVDKVLEPFRPESDQPDLDEFFSQKSDYSLFYQYLSKFGLVSELEDMDQYTLLAPTNTALLQKKGTVTTNFLKYYMIPKMILTPAVINGQREETLLGKDFPLQFTVKNQQVYVNGLLIVKDDLLTSGGVIQGIAQLLHPQLSRCDDKEVNTTRGPCTSCRAANITCPQGYTPVEGAGLVKFQCTYSVGGSAGQTYNYLGCNGMCQSVKVTPACCSGYFGSNCAECPGGPETPCYGNGLCMDGVEGSGECKCFPQFHGEDCGSCLEGLAGPGCNVSINSCDYQNGNCSENAQCSRVGDKVTCRCNDGYIGDGHICYSPCDNQNGKCHEYASCQYDYKTINCTCYPGYHGDGHTCIHTINACARNNGGCSPFAHCLYTPPAVTDITNGTVLCKCLNGYVGNGTWCNRDAYDTLSYLPFTLRFFESLEFVNSDPSAQNLTDLLKDRFQSITVFVPVDESIMDLEMLSLRDLNNHVVNNSRVYLNTSVSFPLTVESLDGQPLVITRNGSYYQVNGIQIVDPNIQTLNGYIHLIQRPLWADEDNKPGVKTDTTTTTKAGTGRIVGPVVGVLLILIIITIIIAVLVYRRTKVTGFMDVWRRLRKGSDSSLSFARLQAHQGDSDSGTFQQADNINFHNPLYSSRASDDS